MPIGIVSDSDFDSELAKPTNKQSNQLIKDTTDALVLDKLPLGRGENNVAVPESIQKLIGETAISENRTSAIALGKHFGISPSSVSAYANGATSTASYNSAKPSLRDNINKTKERIGKKASNRLVMALNQITEEKLEAASLKVISSVAKDMASVMKDMEPPPVKTESDDKRPIFVIHAPQIKTEDKFESIVVNE